MVLETRTTNHSAMVKTMAPSCADRAWRERRESRPAHSQMLALSTFAANPLSNQIKRDSLGYQWAVASMTLGQ